MRAEPLADLAAQIPTSWEVRRLCEVAEVNRQVLRENTDPDFMFEYVDISALDSLGRIAESAPIAFEDAPSRARRVLRDDDVLVSTVRTYLRAIARVPEARGRIASTGFAVVSPGDSVDASFLHWWLSSTPLVEQIVAQSVGVSYPAINGSDVGRMPVPLPPRAVQKRIAAYLDLQCARLDGLVAEQRRQRQLLEERFRSALVRHFIPDQVDDRHELVRMKYLFEFERNGIWGEEPTGGDDDVRCIRVADFDRFAFRAGEQSETRRSVPENQARPRLLRSGDVLLEKSGGTQGKPVGCAVTYEGSGRAVCSNFVAQLRPLPEHNPRFLGLLLAAHYQARLNAPFVKQTTGIQNLDSAAYLGGYARVPSRVEQDQIVRRVEDELDLASRALNQYHEAEALLAERRNAVITAAVTGQLGVA